MTCAVLVRPTTFRRTVAPTTEPLTLAEAQAHLRQTDPNHTAEIQALLAAARARAEGYCERAFLTQTWEARLDDFWGSADLLLPYPNLISVTAIKYLADESDTETTVDSALYEVDVASCPGRVRLRSGEAWPVAYARPGAVRVPYTAGYGAAETAVPDTIRHAVRLLLGHYDRHREGVLSGTISAELPEGVKSLLDLERIPWAD